MFSTVILAQLLIFLSLFSSISHSSQTHNHETSKDTHSTSRINQIGQHELSYLQSKFTSELKHFPVETITSEKLIEIFDNPANKLLKYFVIDTYQNAKEFYHINEPIDTVLAPRPWIVIKKFLFRPNADHQSMIKNIIFEKYTGILESDMIAVGEWNYPKTQKECATRPLFIGYAISDTWGNGASTMSGWLRLCPACVTYWFVNSGEHNARVATRYASSEECTNKLNKYECISLPSTSCQLPATFLQGKDTVQTRGDRIYFDKAAPDGQVVEKNDHNKININKKLKKGFVSFDMEKYEYTVHSLDMKHSYLTTGKNPDITADTTASMKTKGEMNIDQIKNIFGYAYRYNTAFRWKMQHYIDKFRASSHPLFMSNQTCVFAHIRKDDRTLPDKSLNVIDWCRAHTRKNEKTGLCVYICPFVPAVNNNT